MSQISRAIIGGAAAALTLGAIQFAFGSDLRGTVNDETSMTATVVNRAGKSDRAVVVPAQSEPGRTLSFRFNSLSDTSVLMRLPTERLKVEAFRVTAVPAKMPSRASAVACEPPVSVLTEVAKLLQPGRCVT